MLPDRQAPVVAKWFTPKGNNHKTQTHKVFCVKSNVYRNNPARPKAHKAKQNKVVSVNILAQAHLLSNGDLASVLLFGSFLAWGVITRISLKRRQRAGELTLRPFVSAKWDLAAVVVGLGVYGLFIWKLHALLFGVAPLPM
ncbi:MAG: NnrU family protein [Rhizobium sp.]|nr:NnrU family protein [Rhizobium sp.]